MNYSCRQLVASEVPVLKELLRVFGLALVALFLAGCMQQPVPPSSDTEPVVQKKSIQLFYYDSSQDQDENGQILCSEKGLVAVEREIPVSQNLIYDAVDLLLEGELTAEERDRGITTEYPLPGVELEEVFTKNDIVFLQLADPEYKTSGGACRVSILRYQIEATVRQFEGANEVIFTPEELFQP